MLMLKTLSSNINLENIAQKMTNMLRGINIKKYGLSKK
jgi:hypothetical protein